MVGSVDDEMYVTEVKISPGLGVRSLRAYFSFTIYAAFAEIHRAH